MSNEEDVPTFVPRPVKENKRKRALLPEYPKPKKMTARKPNKNVIPLTVESVLLLRDEEEEEGDNESTLAVRTKRATDASMPAGSMMPYGAPSRTENIPERGSGRVPELSDVEDASHQNQPVGVTIEEPFEPLQAEGNAPSESLGAAGDVAGAGDESDLFHGLGQALNQAAAIHREQCSRSHNELHRYVADLKHATDERNSLKLSLRQREEEIKDLRAELAKAYRDQSDLSEQGSCARRIDVIRIESLRWKEGMDRFAVEKETARAQLSSYETQLQTMKEKGLVQARIIKELEARLASVLAKAESDAETAKTYADALVVVYRADAEAAQVQARKAAESANGRAHWAAELAKYRSRRETLEEIHARDFDLTEEIKRAKELEADAEALVSDDYNDNDGSKSRSENGGEPDKEETAPV
ncbi:uncharacterized protein [Nicotiana tomentosiformis]|uniref:uncharacterized protein n=1 Tax=Nicotiana tomentosiformis TaxID=4098 RepID=UPI00388CBFE9